MEEHPQQVRRITALKETKRGRMAVFFDGEFDFSVDDETLLRHDLKVGKRLDERAYEQLREQTQYQKAKEKAFSLLSRRSYAGAQLRQKLEGDFSPDCIDRVMERCAELGLIDDLDYAQRAARDLVHLKHYSLSRVRQELAHRGIGQNEIEDALEQFADYDERQALRQLLEKKYAASLREEKGRRRAFSALVRLGYDPREIRGEMEKLRAESSDEEPEEHSPSARPVQLPPLRQLLEKKYGSVLHDPKGQARAIRGLMRRGYPYGEIRREIEALQQERETEE